MVLDLGGKAFEPVQTVAQSGALLKYDLGLLGLVPETLSGDKRLNFRQPFSMLSRSKDNLGVFQAWQRYPLRLA